MITGTAAFDLRDSILGRQRLDLRPPLRQFLIYFAEEAKNGVLAGLAASLRGGGFLFLGGTEIIHDPPALGLIRRSPSLYEKVGGTLP